MSTTPSPETDPTPDVVDSALIASLEGSHPSAIDLYDELKRNAPEIAFWLRRRATELNPELTDRANESQLALEVAKLCLGRTAEGPQVAAEVASMEALFAETADHASDA